MSKKKSQIALEEALKDASNKMGQPDWLDNIVLDPKIAKRVFEDPETSAIFRKMHQQHLLDTANTLTSKCRGLFAEVNINDFVKTKAKDRSETAKHLPDFLNSISNMITSEIVSKKTQNERIAVAERWIQISKILVEKNSDLHSAQGVSAAFNSSIVKAYTNNLSGLSKEGKAQLESLKTLFSPKGSFHAQGEALLNSEGVLTPFSGVYSTYGTFISDGNPWLDIAKNKSERGDFIQQTLFRRSKYLLEEVKERISKTPPLTQNPLTQKTVKEMLEKAEEMFRDDAKSDEIEEDWWKELEKTPRSERQRWKATNNQKKAVKKLYEFKEGGLFKRVTQRKTVTPSKTQTEVQTERKTFREVVNKRISKEAKEASERLLKVPPDDAGREELVEFYAQYETLSSLLSHYKIALKETKVSVESDPTYQKLQMLVEKNQEQANTILNTLTQPANATEKATQIPKDSSQGQPAPRERTSRKATPQFLAIVGSVEGFIANTRNDVSDFKARVSQVTSSGSSNETMQETLNTEIAEKIQEVTEQAKNIKSRYPNLFQDKSNEFDNFLNSLNECKKNLDKFEANRADNSEESGNTGFTK